MSLDKDIIFYWVRKWCYDVKIQPHEVCCVLSRTRGSVKTTVHIVPAKNQVLALLKDSVVLLDEK